MFCIYSVDLYMSGLWHKEGLLLKLSIRCRVLLLLMVSVFAVLLAVGAVAFYGLHNSKSAMTRQSENMGGFLAESMGNQMAKQTKARLQEVTIAKAQHLERELHIVGEDLKYMAEAMQIIMTSPEHYRSRTLPDTRQEPDILSGTPYIHYSPKLLASGIDDDLRDEIALASNFADVLVPMSKSYSGYRTSLYAGSRKGYFIGVDIGPSDDGKASIFPSPALREQFLEKFDPRERFWYKLGEQADKPVYSDLYRGADGHMSVTCAMPYYDQDGFAGVVGIGYSVDDLYHVLVESAVGQTGISFVLDSNGQVVFSSEGEGILAASPETLDIRELSEQEPSIAEAARHMSAGETGVTSVTMDDEDYYLAYAPLESVGWSFGILIDSREVITPVEEVKNAVLLQMGEFQAIVQQIFTESLLRVALVLLPLLLLLIYASGFMAVRLTKPLRLLTERVKEIAAGNFKTKISINTGDEIENLANCFNTMTDDLQHYTDNLAQIAAEKERNLTELAVAAQIQQDMLPNHFPAFPERHDFSIFAVMDPAKDVGGDFYDYYIIGERYLVITIADVSGKGVPAALFMAKSQSVLKNCVLGTKNPENLGRILEKANHELCQHNEATMFITVLMGVLDLQSGHFTYADGGHCPPLLEHAGNVDFLPLQKSCALGLMDMSYGQQSIDLAPGDSLFLYTDGVSEAMNPEGQLFTEERIKETLNSLPKGQNPEELLPRMQASIRKYADTAEQSDDITMLGLRYYGSEQADAQIEK